MRHLDDIALTQSQLQALAEIRRRLVEDFETESVILYGSVARGQADAQSDIDLLVLTRHPLSRPDRHKITDMVFEVNLRNDTNFSTLVIDRASWNEGPLSVLPLRAEIMKEGVAV